MLTTVTPMKEQSRVKRPFCPGVLLDAGPSTPAVAAKKNRNSCHSCHFLRVTRIGWLAGCDRLGSFIALRHVLDITAYRGPRIPERNRNVIRPQRYRPTTPLE